MENIIDIMGLIILGLLTIGYLIIAGLTIKWVTKLMIEVLKNW